MCKTIITFIILFMGINSTNAQNRVLHIGTASNFVPTLEKLSESFTQKTGHKIIVTKGATGVLYAQIIQGAPFDVFLSADVKRAQKLEEDSIAIQNSRFTYAVGILALWNPSGQTDTLENTLNDKSIKHIAIANPNIAPYGAAAKEALIHMESWQGNQQKLLLSSNISQTFHFTQRGNKTIGFVALSQLLKQNTPKNRYWIIPNNYHAPIKQQAILIKNSPEAYEFMTFLKSKVAQELIIADGYKMGIKE